jgi:hypothetical protein
MALLCLRKYNQPDHQTSLLIQLRERTNEVWQPSRQVPLVERRPFHFRICRCPC